MSGFFAKIQDLIQYRRFYLRMFWFWLFPEPDPIYPDYILEAAEYENCDPSEIMWCDTCKDWHASYYG